MTAAIERRERKPSAAVSASGVLASHDDLVSHLGVRFRAEGRIEHQPRPGTAPGADGPGRVETQQPVGMAEIPGQDRMGFITADVAEGVDQERFEVGAGRLRLLGRVGLVGVWPGVSSGSSPGVVGDDSSGAGVVVSDDGSSPASSGRGSTQAAAARATTRATTRVMRRPGRRIPTTLRDALDALADDAVIRSALPGALYRVYDEYKRDEWNRFIWQTSDWDVKTYLDCLP